MGSRLDIYNWPSVYISWVRKKWASGLTQLASCFHFLRQEIGGLQVRHLKSASCLLSEMEAMTETG